MTGEFRANARITLIIIGANLAINGCALLGYNAMRQTAMHQARIERQSLSRKMDDAWRQRIILTSHLEKACRR